MWRGHQHHPVPACTTRHLPKAAHTAFVSGADNSEDPEVMAPKRTATPLDRSALHKRYQDATEEMTSVHSLIVESLQQLDEKEAAWQALNQRVHEASKNMGDTVTLNVGGRIFTTAKVNLLRFEGSYFHAMLASGQWKPDSDGAYFIDLSPKQFDRVLDFLRSGELSFDGLRPDQVKQLRKTLDYLQLSPEIEEPLQWDPQYCGNLISLSDDSRVATSVTSAWHAVQTTTPCARFTVQLVQGEGVMIGFAPRAGFAPSEANYSSFGWYFYVKSGSLYAQGAVLGRTYSSRVEVGGKVTAILDRQSNRISFEVDGRSLGTAYTNIPAGAMHATVCINIGSVALDDE